MSYHLEGLCTEEDGHEHEFVSVCCGKGDFIIEGVCRQCKEFTTFECSCGRERSETDD